MWHLRMLLFSLNSWHLFHPLLLSISAAIMLQALDLAKAAMFNLSLAGNILKISVIWLLASKESFGIMEPQSG
jgi:hypothetical protein